MTPAELAAINLNAIRARLDKRPLYDGQVFPQDFDSHFADWAREVIPTLLSEVDRLREACRAVLLFYRVGAFGSEEAKEWDKLTGGADCTTKGMCDFIRAALSPEAADA